jgi:hypothetical protein
MHPIPGFTGSLWPNGKMERLIQLTITKLSRNFIQVGTKEVFSLTEFPRIGNDTRHYTLAPAERADVLINFSAFEPGTSLVLLNYAPSDRLVMTTYADK